MYVVLLTYTAPLEEIDYALPDHQQWVGRQYDAGHFIASGRRNPRTGGVIITKAMSRDKLSAILASDPWADRNLVHYEVFEFQATRTCPALREYNEALAG